MFVSDTKKLKIKMYNFHLIGEMAAKLQAYFVIVVAPPVAGI